MPRERSLAASRWSSALRELELANVLRTGCVRPRMTAQLAQQVLSRVASLPIDVDRHAALHSEALALALRFGLRRCEAAHLERALRCQLPLATQDEALRDAAKACGVG